MIDKLLITTIENYSVAGLIFTASAVMILTSTICFFLINIVRIVFHFNYKSNRYFQSINRALGIVVAIFIAFLIVSIIMNHF